MTGTAVTLLSGGIDSATCMAIACRDHDRVIPVHYQYGQQTATLEHHMADNQANHLAARYSDTEVLPLQIVDYETVFDHFAGGVASDRDSFVTEDGDLEGDDGRSTGYVPMRNLHLLATGAAIADVRDGDALYHGAQLGDAEAYPDCRPQFMNAAGDAINYSLADGDSLSIVNPLLDLSKVEVIQTGADLGVDFSWTYSCYESEDDLVDPTPCGECPACVERIEAFKEAGVEDPHMPEVPANE